MKTFLSLFLIILSIIGITDSSFITYEKFAGSTIACGPGFDCGAVLNSQWANIGPIPLSLLGLIFYLTIFILAILNYLEVDIKKLLINVTKKTTIKNNLITDKNILTINLMTTQELLLLITIFGVTFSGFLVYLMAFVIHAWCKYCLISAFTSFTLFLTSFFYYSKFQKNSPFILKKITFSIIHFFYTNFVKKIFFLFDAENIHDLHTNLGKKLGSNKIARLLTASFFSFSHSNLKKRINGITFKNPVGLSAGFDYNGELTGILPEVGFGFHTIGTVTFESYKGNKKPRLGRFLKSQSLLVNKGLKSLGAKKIAKKLTGIKFNIPTGISIASTNRHFNSEKEQILDIVKTFNIFEKSKVKHSYYELNISCPNTFGGEPFTTPNRLKILLSILEKLNISKPVFIKMPIDQSENETLKLLKIIDRFTIAGVIFGNLTKDRSNPSVDKNDKKIWKTVKGNLSGKPTWNRSNKLIKLTRKNFGNRFTIIGTGGIFSGHDAIKKIEYGADLVQLITGMIFEGPQVLGEISWELSKKSLNKELKK